LRGSPTLLIVSVLLLAPSLSAAGTIVRISTSVGDFSIELYDAITWRTVQNFLGYVDRGDYDQTYIHRTLDPTAGGLGIIQGGGFSFRPFFGPVEVPKQDPVQNEPGFSNVRGTIAMAKFSGDANSATSQWFFNTIDNGFSLDNQNGGFTVFGEVMGGEDGMAVLDAIEGLQKIDLGPRASLAPIITETYSSPLEFVYVTMEAVDRYSTAVNMFDPSSLLLLSSVAIDDGSEAYSVHFSVMEEGDDVFLEPVGSTQVLLQEAPPGAASYSSATESLVFPRIELSATDEACNVTFELVDPQQFRFRLAGVGNC